MKPFDYIVVLVSILIGLAIGDLTLSLHRLLRAGRRVKWHWAAPTCGFLAALVILRHFWVYWHAYHDVESVGLARFLPTVGILVILFLGSAAALPDEVPPQGIDLKVFYLGNRLYYWSLMIAWIASVTTMNLTVNILRGHPIFYLQVAENVAVAAIALSFIFVRNMVWHAVGLALLCVAAVLSWAGLMIG